MADAGKQQGGGGAATLPQTFVAAVNPDSAGSEPPPGIDAGTPDHLPGPWAVAIGPGLGPRDEQPDARVGELIVPDLQRHAAIAIRVGVLAYPDGVGATGRR